MKQKKRWSFLSSSIAFTIFLFGCYQTKQNKEELRTGFWRMEMELSEGKILPFEFELNKNNQSWSMIIFNGEEEIEVDEVSWKNDTLAVQLPIFESEFVLVPENREKLKGYWWNYYKGEDYKIKVQAEYGKGTRFFGLSENYDKNFGGKYEVVFSPKTNDQYKSIGIFEQKGNKVSGTFATETGDYRHLSGNVSNNKLMLSTFDGSHAFLFEAEKNDSGLKGMFYSGIHWEEPWVAVKNENAKLKNPDSLTYLNSGYDRFFFRFPNTNGDTITLDDKKYKGKPLIVQIMGSWCPNCLDETKYLTSLYNNYNSKGLEIIAIAFERTTSEEKALTNLQKLKAKTGASYEFLLGGATRKEKAEEKLPMLNHIMSYPTAIFIDQSGKIRRIHTGFYGPSTGRYYDEFTRKTETLVKEMLKD